MLNYLIKRFFAKFGVIVQKENPEWAFVPHSKTPEGIYQELLKRYKINLILDIGANTGYWAQNIKENGYTARIISFEPQDSVYNQLFISSQSDPKWQVMKVALGDKNETSDFHLSQHNESSSLSEMLDTHQDAFHGSCMTNEKIKVSVQTLDSLLPKLLQGEDSIFAKIDVQGFEKKVLNGATESLKEIKMLQLEISFKKLYADDVLFQEMYDYLNDLDFKLIHITPGFKNEKTSELLQVDAIFVRA